MSSYLPICGSQYRRIACCKVALQNSIFGDFAESGRNDIAIESAVNYDVFGLIEIAFYFCIRGEVKAGHLPIVEGGAFSGHGFVGSLISGLS